MTEQPTLEPEHPTTNGFVRRLFKLDTSSDSTDKTNELSISTLTAPSITKKIITVTRSEQIHIQYDEHISHLCHTAKNLWNESNYIIRQEFFNNHRYIDNREMKKLMKASENAKQLYSSTAQLVLEVLHRSWKSFFEGIKDWKVNPSKYTGRPRIPNYKKKDGEFILIFTNQACTLNNYINLSKGEGENNKYLKIIKHMYGTINPNETYLIFPDNTNIKPIKTRLDINTDLREVRIVPQGGGYKIEIVYDKKVEIQSLDKSRIVGIDYGLSNVVAMANNIDSRPIVIKGSIVKSINQWYNKRRSQLYEIYDRQPIACDVKTKRLIFNRDTRKLQSLTAHRNRLMKDIMHKISRYIINYCVQHNIGTIVIGHNNMWKQKINLGTKTNQNFVTIPYYILTKDIEYKGSEVGIDVLVRDESHTSKCSFLDNESLEHHDKYVGKRIKRGLFKSSKGLILNADVHAALNIIRKVFPNAFSHANGIAGTLTYPVRISVKDLLNKSLITSVKLTNMTI